MKRLDKIKKMIPTCDWDDKKFSDYKEWLKENHFLIEEGDNFLGCIFVEDMFYSRPGTYTPEWGYNFDGMTKHDIHNMLKELYNEMVKRKSYAHSISIFEGDQLNQLFSDLCYGSRCMDAHTSIEDRSYQLDYTEVKEVDKLVDLLRKMHGTLNESPNFLGFKFDDESKTIEEWMADDQIVLKYIEDKGQVIGFLKLLLGGCGGCDMSSNKETLGIDGLYIEEDYRGKGYATDALNYSHHYGKENDFSILAVDYETMNVNAHHFWSKHFKHTIRSFTRHIG